MKQWSFFLKLTYDQDESRMPSKRSPIFLVVAWNRGLARRKSGMKSAKGMQAVLIGRLQKEVSSTQLWLWETDLTSIEPTGRRCESLCVLPTPLLLSLPLSKLGLCRSYCRTNPFVKSVTYIAANHRDLITAARNVKKIIGHQRRTSDGKWPRQHQEWTKKRIPTQNEIALYWSVENVKAFAWAGVFPPKMRQLHTESRSRRRIVRNQWLAFAARRLQSPPNGKPQTFLCLSVTCSYRKLFFDMHIFTQNFPDLNYPSFFTSLPANNRTNPCDYLHTLTWPRLIRRKAANMPIVVDYFPV